MPTNAERTPAQRVIETHALLQSGGAIGGWASAHWQGAPFNDGMAGDRSLERPVLVCIGPDRQIRRQAGIEISRDRLPESDMIDVRGVACTAPLRTALDLARRAATLVEAVVAHDTLLECGLIDLPRLRNYVSAHRGWNGIPQAREAVDLAVTGVRSPPETRLRLVWQCEAGFPRLLVNSPVFDNRGRLLGIPDCLDAESGTVLEYDGEGHHEDAQRTSDLARDELFRSHGLIVERVTSYDLAAETRDTLIERFTAARLQGLMRGSPSGTWTLRRHHDDETPA